ncbi:MAG: dinitrogenase iron-molybdenum cofactor [Candidatus Omnitrophota bacterium]|nr:MAG: dinitrogenase iron-molybdenum cofactor [Candidatus Omnitrophota bacterium]
MRVAIPTEGDFVSMHFGRCPIFTLVDIENGKVVKKEEIINPGHQLGAIPQFLYQKGVDCVVAGGIGSRAISFFAQFNIKTIVGVSGKIEEIIEQLRKGTLKGGKSFCEPGSGKGYGVDKTECHHPHKDEGRC